MRNGRLFYEDGSVVASSHAHDRAINFARPTSTYLASNPIIQTRLYQNATPSAHTASAVRAYP